MRRYNSAAEKQEYIDTIKSSVEWLGHKPFKVTAEEVQVDSVCV